MYANKTASRQCERVTNAEVVAKKVQHERKDVNSVWCHSIFIQNEQLTYIMCQHYNKLCLMHAPFPTSALP